MMEKLIVNQINIIELSRELKRTKGNHFVIYHQAVKTEGKQVDCPDGVLAAWAIDLYLKQLGITNCELIGDKYQNAEYWEFKTAFDLPFQPQSGDYLWLADFSYPTRIIKELINMGVTVLMFEDEPSYIDDLSSLSDRLTNNKDYLMGGVTDRCGSWFVWETLFPKEQHPWFFPPSLDRDRGLNNYYSGGAPESLAICTKMSELRKGLVGKAAFAVFDFLMVSSREEVLSAGRELLREQDELIESEVERWALFTPEITFVTQTTDDTDRCIVTKYTVPYLVVSEKASFLYSRIAHRILEESGHDFVAVQTANDLAAMHLRAEGKFDCSVLADYFGGGGKPNAAGFSI